jgi:hypothetical protein
MNEQVTVAKVVRSAVRFTVAVAFGCGTLDCASGGVDCLLNVVYLDVYAPAEEIDTATVTKGSCSVFVDSTTIDLRGSGDCEIRIVLKGGRTETEQVHIDRIEGDCGQRCGRRGIGTYEVKNTIPHFCGPVDNRPADGGVD